MSGLRKQLKFLKYFVTAHLKHKMNHIVKFQANKFFSFPRNRDESVSQYCLTHITDRHSFQQSIALIRDL